MKTKIIRVLGLIGLLLFFTTLIIYLIMGLFLPPLLITLEFAKIMHPLAFIVSIYVSFSLMLAYYGNMLELSKSASKRTSSYKKQKRETLITIFSSIFLGLMIYLMIPNVVAYSLHINAPKENIQIEATATSVWTASKDLRKNCQHYLLFDNPKISTDLKFVCIKWNEWLYFRNADFPIAITLYGEKSYYGYKLRFYK